MSLDVSRALSRRDFLASGLALAGTLALGGRSSLARTAPAGDYGPFKMGLQSYSLRHYKVKRPWPRPRSWASTTGNPTAPTPIPTPPRPTESKSLAAASGVEIIGFGVSGFSKDHDKNRKLFEFGKAAGHRLPLGRPRRPTPSTAWTS